MNRYALLCRTILETPSITQRELAQLFDLSLGSINALIKESIALLLLESSADTGQYQLLPAGQQLLEEYRVDGALILAAGFGSRFVPLTFEIPKGLLEVFNERMIERQIKQLHEAGISDITIVVGYLKEKFEYLIDQYNVKLLYNAEYASKNTLATLYHAKDLLMKQNMYVLSSDNWMRANMFHKYECGSWYASVFQPGNTSEWCLTSNKKGKIQSIQIGGNDSWIMYGPVFLRREWSAAFFPILSSYYNAPGTEQYYWEQVYLEMLNGSAKEKSHTRFTVPELYMNCQPADQIYEFENLEELRCFDSKYQVQSDNKALALIAKVFHLPESEIQNIRCLKAGMTNNSFLFEVQGTQYICRIPGAGTDLLINRKQEKAAFEVVAPLGISEELVFFEAETGYKISRYYEGARNSNALDWNDVTKSMDLLRRFHSAALQTDHRFDIRERIHYYEMLCGDHTTLLFEDYAKVRSWMDQLMDQLDRFHHPQIMSHIDSVADNFIFLPNGEARLIDWEYAGMCDPLIDISMYAIYSYYNEDQIEKLIHIYLQRVPSEEERFTIYAYIALGGFLWSLWAIYKSRLGEEFGEYTIEMYRYAKKYWVNCNKIVIL